MHRPLFLLFHLMLHGCWASRPPPLPPSSKLFAVKTNCTRDVFNVKLDLLGKPFKGVIFAKDFLDECRTNGNLTSTVVISMPTAGCGIRSEHRADGTYELSVQLIMQMDGKLRQMSDVKTVVRCSLPDNMMSMPIDVQVDAQSIRATGALGTRNGRMRHLEPLLAPSDDESQSQSAPDEEPTVEATDHKPRVRVWLELGGANGSGAVEVGEMTTVAVRAVLPGNIGVRVVDCAALDGIGEASQKLLDERGCPVDEQVMPALYTRLRSMDDGWSKPHADDLVEKLFTASFPAFKFPDRERLHVSCGVQLCKENCPTVDCGGNEQLVLGVDKHLARIEVFNSLSVTAPKIDLDRVRSMSAPGMANVTVDEYPSRLRSLHAEGILCMSTSRLALAFCVLGLIFLVAVVVSVCCLLRARSRSKHTHHHLRTSTGTSIFSSSSGSHSRFGSKLIISSGGSLPYGRVY